MGWGVIMLYGDMKHVPHTQANDNNNIVRVKDTSLSNGENVIDKYHICIAEYNQRASL